MKIDTDRPNHHALHVARRSQDRISVRSVLYDDSHHLEPRRALIKLSIAEARALCDALHDLIEGDL